MGKPVKCFIVEGENRDIHFIKEMSQVFFKGRYESVVISLPAARNIYMLYEAMEKDNFETDLIELLREEVGEAREALEGVSRQNIDEVYLFFDFDIHQDNLPDGEDPMVVLEKMIRFFDNETENGKLYVSYPMVEAIYDFKDGQCDPHTACWYPINRIGEYKRAVGDENRKAGSHFSKYEEWQMLISIFGLRVKCLFDLGKIDFSHYKSSITVKTVFERQKAMVEKFGLVFILSAFPEFLLDYFRSDFWRKHITRHKHKFDNCPKDMN